MENPKNNEMILQIKNKLNIDFDAYNIPDTKEVHEKDNIPNPFDQLSLEELLFFRENNYFQNAL